MRVHPIIDTVTALCLAAALLFGGNLMARQLTESAFYRQSQIIRSIFSGVESREEAPGLTRMLTDADSRDLLFKFAGALANAYVSFELIPVHETETFTAIYASMGDSVVIEEFLYHRKNLTITGLAADVAAYSAFLENLRSTGHFDQVSGQSFAASEGGVTFEIECIAPE